MQSKRLRLRIIVSVLLILVALGAVAAGFIANRLSTTSIPAGTASGELAFISDRDGGWDIFILGADGELRNLTGQYDEVADYFVSFDFTSERLNFLSGRIGELGPTQVQPDGSNLRTLGIVDAVTTMFFENRFDWDPHWSPAGDGTLVFASLRDLNLELYTADADDNRVRLTNDGGRDWFADWSPDGTKIVFNSDRTGNEDLYMMDADGGNLRQITTHESDDIRGAWSLDGESLLFTSQRNIDLMTGQIEYFIVPADGDEDDVRPLGADEIFEGGAVWSADGREMAFMSNREIENGQRVWNLYVQNADGSSLRRLTDGAGNDVFPVWRP